MDYGHEGSVEKKSRVVSLKGVGGKLPVVK
jgi:hypothetical protein